MVLLDQAQWQGDKIMHGKNKFKELMMWLSNEKRSYKRKSLSKGYKFIYSIGSAPAKAYDSPKMH